MLSHAGLKAQIKKPGLGGVGLEPGPHMENQA